MKNKADLLLHPIRMRIIQALYSYKNMTPKQLLEVLTDIPQATMYRQLKHLLDAELIHVVESKQIRGAKEKVYAVNQENLKIPDGEIESSSPEELVQLFMAYQSNLLKEFEQYVTNNRSQNFKHDGLGFSQLTLHLTNTELHQFSKEINEVIKKYTSLEPSSNRSALTLGTISIPQKFTEEKP